MKKLDFAQHGSWTERAACKGEDMTNPDNVSICEACPVLPECRAWALTSPDPAYGHVAGGLTPRQRRRERRNRNVA